jgi:lipoyl-dependent peroxiredoxin
LVSFRVVRHAQASWQGTVAAGGGRLALGSGAYDGPFSLKARTEDVEQATNPEELIGAAIAGCFTMSLANLLSESGHPPADIQTTADVRLEQVDGRFTISVIELSTVGDVPGVDGKRFADLAREAKDTCTVSRALAATRIEITASLAA